MVHITMGVRHLSLVKCSVVLEGWGRLSSRAQRSVKGEEWQMRNRVISFLSNLILPAYPHVCPTCSPRVTRILQSIVRVMCQLLTQLCSRWVLKWLWGFQYHQGVQHP